MKKIFSLMAVAVVAVMAAMFTSCSKDDNNEEHKTNYYAAYGQVVADEFTKDCITGDIIVSTPGRGEKRFPLTFAKRANSKTGLNEYECVGAVTDTKGGKYKVSFDIKVKEDIVVSGDKVDLLFAVGTAAGQIASPDAVSQLSSDISISALKGLAADKYVEALTRKVELANKRTNEANLN